MLYESVNILAILENEAYRQQVGQAHRLPTVPSSNEPFREVVYPGITYQGLSWGYHSLYPSVGELTSCIRTNHQREWSFYREPGMEKRLHH